MYQFTTQQPICYEVKRRQGKQYALFKMEDVKQAIDYICEFQCYVNRFYNISVKPYRGKHWNPQKFVWVVEG